MVWGSRLNGVGFRVAWCRVPDLNAGGGDRVHPENAHMSGRHGVQYVAQCVACAALTLVIWQYITNISPGVNGVGCGVDHGVPHVRALGRQPPERRLLRAWRLQFTA